MPTRPFIIDTLLYTSVPWRTQHLEEGTWWELDSSAFDMEVPPDIQTGILVSSVEYPSQHPTQIHTEAHRNNCPRHRPIILQRSCCPNLSTTAQSRPQFIHSCSLSPVHPTCARPLFTKAYDESLDASNPRTFYLPRPPADPSLRKSPLLPILISRSNLPLVGHLPGKLALQTRLVPYQLAQTNIGHRKINRKPEPRTPS